MEDARATRGKGYLTLSTNVSTPWLFQAFSRNRPAPLDAPCGDLWAKTRAVRWVNESVAWPASPLDGALVNATRFPYYNLDTMGCDGAGYGCWYYLTPGFGTRIRLGTVLELRDRAHMYEWIDATVSPSYAFWSTAWCELHPFCTSWRHADTGVCAAAAAHGADTVVIGTGWDALGKMDMALMPELVLCSGVCMREVQCDECPAVEYAPDCVCSVGFGVSNCNNDTAVPPIARCGEQSMDLALVYTNVHWQLQHLWPLWWGLLGGLVWVCARRRCSKSQGAFCKEWSKRPLDGTRILPTHERP